MFNQNNITWKTDVLVLFVVIVFQGPIFMLQDSLLRMYNI